MLLGIYPGVTQHMHHDAVMTLVATLGTFVPAEWLKSAHDGTLLGTGTHSIAWASWSWCWYYPHCTSTRHEWGDMTWWRCWALRLPMSDIYIGPVWCLVLWRELYSGAGNEQSQSFTSWRRPLLHTAPRWRCCCVSQLFLRPLIQPTQAEQLCSVQSSCSACVGWIGWRRRNRSHSTQRQRGAVTMHAKL